MSADPAFRMDPEVLADLQLREQSVHDHTRSRREASWVPPVFVLDWKCRHPRCDARVPVTGDVVERLAKFNEHLATRGERPIPCDAVLLCDEHRDEMHQIIGVKLRERTDELRGVIKLLRASKDPMKEAALIARLSELRHPEPALFLAALSARVGSAKKRGPL
jgi:hypothetical protein